MCFPNSIGGANQTRGANSGWKRPTTALFSRVCSLWERYDLESSFFLQANGAHNWSNGSIGTCPNGSTAEFYLLIGRLRIDRDCFAPKRRRKEGLSRAETAWSG